MGTTVLPSVVATGKVVVTVSNPRDRHQRWFKKANATKDQENQPAFAIVNEATNEAIKHDGTNGPMSRVQYDPNSKDKSVLWTESKDADQGFRYICRASSIARHITSNSHILSDGRIVDLWNGNHISERWKFVQYSVDSVDNQLKFTLSCQRKEGHNLTSRGRIAALAPADPKDIYQIWTKYISYAEHVKDQDGKRAFALVNRTTGTAIKHGYGPGNPVLLVEFDENADLDSSILWMESDDKGLGFREIRMASNTNAVFHLDKPDSDKALILQSRNNSNDQRWKFQPINA